MPPAAMDGAARVRYLERCGEPASERVAEPRISIAFDAVPEPLGAGEPRP
jgi:hypothetical protein